MTRPALHRVLCVILCLTASTALAQQYTVKKLIFDGPTPYSQSALEAAAGLKPGQTIAQADLEAAAQRLVDTGAFTEMQTTLDGPIKAISVVFKLKAVDPSRMLTADFANFIWLPPAELATELQKQVPLFNGTVPEAGNQQDAVLAALKQILAAKGIDATISMTPIAPSPSQPLRLIEYSVARPDIRIHSLTLSGVTPPFAADTDKLVHMLTGTRYTEGVVPTSLSNILLTPYRNAGYQAAAISSLSHTVASSTAARVDLDVAATVEPGDLYHLSHLDWQGSPEMSAQAFTAEAELHPGDVASRKALLLSLSKLEAAFHNKGYLDAVVTATPHLDTTAHTVAFTVAADPGAQYTLKSVTALNLSDAQRKDFDRAWNIKPGDIFNQGYVASFLKNNTALLSLSQMTASFKVVADPDAHTVDLIMTFFKAGGRAN
jgi:outer membrane protein insertion porin family